MSTIRYTVIDGEVIAEKRNGVRKLYVPDPLGSTVALLDNTQAQTDTFAYWPYGEDAGRTGTTPTPFQHVGTAGYYRDSSTRGYVRARVLDKQKGRWLTEDPLNNLNLYAYVQNRVVSYTDPSGLETKISPPNTKDWLKCLEKCKGKTGTDFFKCLGTCLSGDFIEQELYGNRMLRLSCLLPTQ